MNNKFYPDNPNATITQPNKDFIHTIKASHFDVGDPRPKSMHNIRNHYLSETKLNLNSKGNAMRVRAVLDADKKKDLTKNHFDIGGPTAHFKTTMQTLQYRPGTAKERSDARPLVSQERRNNIRASHWGVEHQSVTLNANIGNRN